MTNSIIKRALEMEGVPYRQVGRDRRGIDCLGLGLHAFDLVESSIPECVEARHLLAGYYQGRRFRFDPNNPDHARSCRLLQEYLTNHLHPRTLWQLEPGDVLLMSFKTRRRDLGDHLAIYLGREELLHADIERGVVRTDLTDKLRRRTIAAYRG